MAWDSDGIVGVVDEPPEAGFPQAGLVVLAGFGQPPGPRLPVQVVAAVVGDDDLLAESVVAVRRAALALAAPDADQRQQRQQGVVEVGALAQVGGVGAASADPVNTGMLRAAVALARSAAAATASSPEVTTRR